MYKKLKLSSIYGQMGDTMTLVSIEHELKNKDEIVKSINRERLVDICIQLLEFTTNVVNVIKCINVPWNSGITNDIIVISNSNILPEQFYKILPDDIIMVCKAIGFDNFIISFGRLVYSRPLFNNIPDNPFTFAALNLRNFVYNEICLGHIRSTDYDMNIVDKKLTIYNELFKKSLICLLS